MSESTGVLHPKCDKRFPNGNSAGHCAECCQTFIGLKAYDKHLTHVGGNRYIHLIPEDGVDKWWLDDKGAWHYSVPMSDEEKAERFGQTA